MKVRLSRQAAALAACALLALGLVLRMNPAFSGFVGAGYDERIYRSDVNWLVARGVMSYPTLATHYIQVQQHLPQKLVSPLRSLYLIHCALWCGLVRHNTLRAMKDVSCQASVLALVVAGVFGWRAGGTAGGLAMLALMSTAPLQVYGAHRGLIDGYFSALSMLAIWLLWESCAHPEGWIWPTAFGASIALMVMTKETSLFVVGALFLIVAMSGRLGLGGRSARLAAVTFASALAGLLCLTLLLGGFGHLFEVLRLDLVTPLSAYSLARQDGPWYSYLIALICLSPILTMLAGAGAVDEGLTTPSGRLMSLFIVLTLVPLSCLPYQVIPRLATIWDLPLRWLAWLQLSRLARRASPKWAPYVTFLGVSLLTLIGLWQFWRIFDRGLVYDPVIVTLLRALKVVK